MPDGTYENVLAECMFDSIFRDNDYAQNSSPTPGHHQSGSVPTSENSVATPLGTNWLKGCGRIEAHIHYGNKTSKICERLYYHNDLAFLGKLFLRRF